MTTVSKYLRQPSIPAPRFLRFARVATSMGLGVVDRPFWHVPSRGVPHWRAMVKIIDGEVIECAQQHMRRVAVRPVEQDAHQ